MVTEFSRRFCLCATAALLVAVAGSTQQANAQNWARFRGDNGTGISAQKGIPTKWSPGDYAWNIELPGVGHAAPIIWGDNLFVTSAIDKGAVRFLFCLNAKTGEQKWSQSIALNQSRKHNKSSWASSTPASDGERVYVAFADKESCFFAAYDFTGELVWRRNLGAFESQHGQGVSPIIFEDMVIITNDQDGPSSVIALDRATGNTKWSVTRSIRRTSYATPMILKQAGRKTQLICVSGAMGITSLDPYTGNMNWMTGEFPLRTVASPVYGGGLVIASCGQGGRYGVLQIAVDPNGNGHVAETRIKWKRERQIPYVPTPVVKGDHLYEWNDEGIVSCVDIKTGKDVWKNRIGGNYSGSPICIDGKLYGISEAGDVVVVGASPEFKLYGKTSLDDPSHSTPAIANGRLYLRSYHRLACLEARTDK